LYGFDVDIVAMLPNETVCEPFVILQAREPVRVTSGGNSIEIRPFYVIIFKGVISSVYVVGW
jgi:hypothetical protein